MGLFSGRLWHQRDFLKFWAGNTVTQFTGQISGFALPIVAVLVIQVTGFELGVLEAIGFIAFPTIGLIVGVWMDRWRRRRVMVAANLIQVAALGSIPAAFAAGVLSLYQLYAVALVMGATTVFYDVAYQSYLPDLVDKEDVVEGNQKLQVSASASAVVGPSVASLLVQAVGAALSVAADAIGTLAAAFMLVWIRKPEPAPAPSGERHFFAEMKEGIKVVTGNKLLWTQAGCTGTSNLGSSIVGVAIILYIYRVLSISPGIAGVIFTIGAFGFLLGVLVTSRVTAALGLGRTIALASAASLGLFIVLVARGPFAPLIIGVAEFIPAFGAPIYNINQVSLRQIITPNRLQGRMNATIRTIIWGTIPVGSLLGGMFVSALGVVPALVIGILVSGASSLWILLGPIIRLDVQPEPLNE
jgi:Na+/melibiose symporter-like transporter